jgi:hypothetical protein
MQQDAALKNKTPIQSFLTHVGRFLGVFVRNMLPPSSRGIEFVHNIDWY